MIFAFPGSTALQLTSSVGQPPGKVQAINCISIFPYAQFIVGVEMTGYSHLYLLIRAERLEGGEWRQDSDLTSRIKMDPAKSQSGNRGLFYTSIDVKVRQRRVRPQSQA